MSTGVCIFYIITANLFVGETETQDPWHYLAECRTQVKRRVVNPRERVRMFGQVVERNPFTRECGMHIRQNSDMYEDIIQAAAYVSESKYPLGTQNKVRERFLHGKYEN